MPKNSHSNRQWMAKFFRCGMRCYYCCKPLDLLPGQKVEQATKDHLTPILRGGSDAINNIVPACFACNRKKGIRTEEEFRHAVSTAFENAANDVLNPSSPMTLGQRDEPPLEKLRKESESVSWAWRNPACWLFILALSLSVSVRAQEVLPSAPAPVADRSFWAAVAIAGIGTGLDAYTTVTHIGPNKVCRIEVGAPELFGREPHALRTGLVAGALFAGATFSAYELKKHPMRRFGWVGRHLWLAPLANETGSHWRGAIHNFRSCPI